MKKLNTTLLLLSLSFTLTSPLEAQTRHRRVQQAASTSSSGALHHATDSTTTESVAASRPRVLNDRPRTVGRDSYGQDEGMAQEEARVRREDRRRSAWWLLGAGIAIGIGSIGRDRCTPSRGEINQQPRLGW